MSKTYTVPRRLGEAKINHVIAYHGGQWAGSYKKPDGLEAGITQEHLLQLLHWMDQEAQKHYPAYVPLSAKEVMLD